MPFLKLADNTAGICDDVGRLIRLAVLDPPKGEAYRTGLGLRGILPERAGSLLRSYLLVARY